MTSTLCTARIDQVRNLTAGVREFTLHLVQPPELAFSPGQSIAVELPHPETDKPIVRHYSIASPPHHPSKLVLLVSASSQGSGSSFLLTQQEGKKIQFRGPNGEFHLQGDPDTNILFVATGTGIAPFRSMLYAMVEKGWRGSVTLFWGLRSERELYYQEELQALIQRLPTFSFVTTLSRSPKTWEGARGRVTKLVENLPSVNHFSVYLSGNRKMVSEVTHILRQKGHCSIYREKYHDES